jgi:uncharacterized protein involved in outer membrane biogenesis
MKRWQKWLIGIFGALVVVIGAVAIFFDWNWLRGTLADQASSGTGRDVSLGDLQGQWSLVPTITLRDVHIANADWGKVKELFGADMVQVTIDLRELLRGRTVLTEVTLEKPNIALEVREDGTNNWSLGAKAAAETVTPDDRTDVPIIGRLDIQDGVVKYSDPKNGLNIDGKIRTVVAEGGRGNSTVQLSGNGTLQKQPFKIDFTGGSLLSLRENEEPYPLKIAVAAVDSQLEIAGTLDDPVTFDGLDLRAHLRGPDLSRLTTITGVPFPITPAYDLASRLERDGKVFKLSDLKGTMGRSDLNGAVKFDLTNERKYIEADLTSKRLDYRDIGFLIGVPVDEIEAKAAEEKAAAEKAAKDPKEKQPATPQKPTGPPQAVQKVDKPKAPKRVLPDAPLSVKQVRETDAKVKFRGEQVEAPNVPLSGVQLDLELKDGVLHMKPIQVGVAGGTAIADIKINAQKEPVRTDYDIKLRGFELGQFLSKAGLENGGKGRIDGRIRLAGTGDTVAKSLGASNGDIRMVINQGEISNLAVEAAGLDIAEALGLLATKDKPVGIRCFVADLGVNNGVAAPRLFVLDTTDSTILVEGPLDLRSEQMDLRVRTQPKDPSLFAVRTPITVKGSFAEPKIGVEKGPLAARGAAAVALGALLTPVASILAFIEPGLGKDSDCAALLNEVQEPANVRTPDKIEAPRTASPGIPQRKPDFIPRR